MNTQLDVGNADKWYDQAVHDLFSEFERTKMRELKEHYRNNNLLSFQDEVYKNVVTMEEDCCITALETYLGREAGIEDFAKCKRVFREGVHDSFEFGYEDTLLGTVSRVFTSDKITVNFTPNK